MLPSTYPMGILAVHEPPLIELTQVSKRYRSGTLSVRALNEVSLAIRPGEYVAISGPSGSGKSTLMHILGCLDVPTSGEYWLAGEDVGELSEEGLAEIRNERVGFVFQQFNLLPSLSAWRNVELPLTYAGTPRAQRRERAVAALGRVGLADRIEHRPSELSGGQQQRVAVARALVTDPALLLADEPTGNLDSAATADVLDLFDELHAAGRTVVVITHEAEVAARAARVIRIRDGVVLSDSGEPHLGGGPHLGGRPHLGGGPHPGGEPHPGGGPHPGGRPDTGGESQAAGGPHLGDGPHLGGEAAR